jgi:hypothetical protein
MPKSVHPLENCNPQSRQSARLFLHSSELGPPRRAPPPPPQASVPPLRLVPVGGHTRLREKGWVGWPQFGRGARVKGMKGVTLTSLITVLRPNSSTESRQNLLRIFLLAIQSPLYKFALRFLFLQIHTNSYSFHRSITGHCKG